MSSKRLVVDLKRAGLERWRGVATGAAPSGTVRKGSYELGPNEGGVSADTLPASPGKRYRVAFKAKVLMQADNGGETDFRVGPVFLDATGKVVGWWRKQEPFARNERQRKGVVEEIAPENAVAVSIGAFGSWKQKGAPGNGVVALSDLSLTER